MMEEEVINQNGLLIRQLIDAIEDNLANHLPANAVFLAERLLAEHDSEETRSILAECYMAENKHYKVYEILKHCKSEINRYKFALVCLKLNKYQGFENAIFQKEEKQIFKQIFLNPTKIYEQKNAKLFYLNKFKIDGERALLMEHYNSQDIISQSKNRSQSLADYVPNGSYGFYLLGLIFEGQQKFSDAKDYFVKALELNPTLWVAYEKICKIGDQEILPYKVFCETRYKQYIATKKNKNPNFGFNPSVCFKQQKEGSRLFGSVEEPDDNSNITISAMNKSRLIPNTFGQMSNSNNLFKNNRINNILFEQIQLEDTGITRTSAQQITKSGTSNISSGATGSQIGQTGTTRNDSNSRNSSAKRKKSSKLDNGSALLSSIASQSSQSSNLTGSQSIQQGSVPSQIPQTPAQFQSQLPQGGQNVQSFNTGGMSTFQQLINSGNQQFMESRYGMQAPGNQLNPGGQDYFSFKNPQGQQSQIQSQTYNIYAQSSQLNNKNFQNQQMMPGQQLINSQNFFAGGQQQQGNMGGGDQQPIKDICTLLKKFGEAFYHMSLYLCKEAIDYFYNLPRNHQCTGWVLTHIGRCYMEIVKYSEAEKCYAEALRIEPYRLEGIEYYSSCLWHLKKQVELCYLAQQALEKSLFAPETWIAVGNCFSLQKEHENALKFFQRAIQLNQQSAYAHSLCGHEFVYNEDFTRARKSFQQALNLDLRNYNAWWGLGNIFYKQEKYNRAAEHFQNAININQKNPVLYSFMGMTLAADRNYPKALQYFENSEKLDPKNGLNKFQKANTLVKLEKYDAALKELKELHLMMPKEAPIPMLIGKVYKKLKKTDMALKYFTDALDLENKDTQRIKALIESLHQDNQDFGDDLEI